MNPKVADIAPSVTLGITAKAKAMAAEALGAVSMS